MSRSATSDVRHPLTECHVIVATRDWHMIIGRRWRQGESVVNQVARIDFNQGQYVYSYNLNDMTTSDLNTEFNEDRGKSVTMYSIFTRS